jgi:Protein of unknown function (DUF3455)
LRVSLLARAGHGRLISMRALLGLLIAGVMSQSGPNLPAVPDNLKPPAGAKIVLETHAAGDQVYTCSGANWVFSRPDAKLFDESGKQIGSHFAGPTWEASDGSRVTGKAIANATPDPRSIPWLLLAAKDHEGSGLLSSVTHIQRLETKGGMAPVEACDAAHKGEESRAHYTAIYVFYSGS